jgi:hypothetical protein
MSAKVIRRMVASELLSPGGRIGTLKRWRQPMWLAMFYYDDGAILMASFPSKAEAAGFRAGVMEVEICL